MTANGHGVSFGGDGNVLQLMMVMGAHVCDTLNIILRYVLNG